MASASGGLRETDRGLIRERPMNKDPILVREGRTTILRRWKVLNVA